MENDPTSSKMYGLIVLHEMHTDFLFRALEGISEEDAEQRLGTKANHIAWITGSIVYGRFQLTKMLGVNVEASTGAFFENNKGIIAEAKYPSIADFENDWRKISPVLLEALTNATDAQLDAPFEMPELEMTVFDFISFTTYREASCIGQIALWRRLLGYPAMNYM
ncbi:DinB family protein [Pedobacter sp. Leaf194]|uniref:DinB family protein n=1 Tax=Pedobacter sp. Leaf194 TaxID=1736297 RepID=UPI0007039B18|nr:hypothetical protein [Pedobacter sp. Leaf194]KQS36757.1 hypothetical protein ASG14_06880 [Pedobacter sp. Leaf194]